MCQNVFSVIVIYSSALCLTNIILSFITIYSNMKINTLQEWIKGGQLLLGVPPGEPKSLKPSFDEGLLKKLKEDLRKAQQFLEAESTMWWAKFFADLGSEGIVSREHR